MSEISSNVPTDKDEFIVQYPGEYEKDGIYILAIEGNAQKLSYFVLFTPFHIYSYTQGYHLTFSTSIL